MNINLIYTVLRPSQNAVTHANDDGTYTIFINSNKCRDKQLKGLKHELGHINNNDFSSDLHLDLIERMMHDSTSDINFNDFTFFYLN